MEKRIRKLVKRDSDVQKTIAHCMKILNREITVYPSMSHAAKLVLDELGVRYTTALVYEGINPTIKYTLS